MGEGRLPPVRIHYPGSSSCVSVSISELNNRYHTYVTELAIVLSIIKSIRCYLKWYNKRDRSAISAYG